eukprot:CAMPEP_0178422568 /NCGR_PEP_ID=MMETSP0689_2-20121128/27242_1 /TAXON_ID=160604 /ORGANISM="Amphidinium massartii, Strain CS-259" /LENGTH=523 /DNA_ID=CAMNT_0020044139 /DNA_START=58 /DNA_END=1629 /DNA_ORIENTATION=+
MSSSASMGQLTSEAEGRHACHTADAEDGDAELHGLEDSQLLRSEASRPSKPVPNLHEGFWHSGPRLRTVLLICIVSFIEGADTQLLPATFRALEIDLNLSPQGLGRMSLAQSLFMAVAAPVWGSLADRYSRKLLMIVSCVAWACLTQLLALSQSAEVMLILRCLHGAALASMVPIAGSVVADVTEVHHRGVGFGLVYSAAGVGHIVAAMVCTTIANRTFDYGIRGWRLAFSAVAVFSLCSAFMLAVWMEEPRRESGSSTSRALPLPASDGPEQVSRMQHFRAVLQAEASRIHELLRKRTFFIIVLQGIFGSIPWNSMGFMTMYLQYCGHSDRMAATIVSMTHMGKMGGGITGGLIGDAMARRSPTMGRPFTAVISVLSGIPSTVLLVEFAVESEPPLLIALSFLLGFTASWCGAGVNRPILAEVADSHGRASIMAWLVALEGTSASFFGAPVVGYLAETYFGYAKLPADDAKLPDALDANRAALRQAMLCGTTLPWTICACLYIVLCFTYGSDTKGSVARAQK